MRGRGKAFLLGAVLAVALELVAAVVVLVTGIVDVAAVPHGLPDRVLGYASTRSIAHHARREPNPLGSDPAAARRGLARYAALCVACHGGPGVASREFAAGLHPPPPDLASPRVQAFTDGMLYDTVARGIGSTGMPAFGPARTPDELWSIVAFVRRLPALGAAEREELARLSAGGGQEGAGPSAGATPSPGVNGTSGPSASSGSPPAGPGARVHQVTIAGFKFEPATLTVRVGDVVEWRNRDFVPHTATAEDQGFDTGRIDPDGTKRVVVSKRGRFAYVCRYHLAMKGTVVAE